VRLEKEEHMSFLEFNYMVLQAYDFYYLYEKYGCSLQLCGADQWGNVVAGVELVRRLQFAKYGVGGDGDEKMELIGLSTPLILDANGKKLGKSEGNAVWVNEELLSPFDYYQYFRNTNDADVLKFLKVYTDMPVEEIDSMEHRDINELKKILAFETTKICHGEKIAKECLEKSEQIFERGDISSLESIEYSTSDSTVPLYTILKELDLVKSNGEAKRLIAGGGVRVNDEKIIDESHIISLETEKEIKISLGRKKILKISLIRK
jgi:tyrosyl-tRNA synthetase